MPKYDDFMDIVTILDDYSKDIYEGVEQASIEVAKEGASKLKKTSPKRTGKYRRSWKVKKEKGMYEFSNIIYNQEWQLTHLLEKGHAIKRNGTVRGEARAKVHIRPVEQECVNEYLQDVTNIIKKGA